MSNSELATVKMLTENHYNGRNHKIDTITIHHMAGNLSVEACGQLFLRPSRKASSNYGIGTDGRIGLYVEEKNAPWTSGNYANDNRAVTIEVANDGDASTGWHISDKAIASTIKLCADICRRNGIDALRWKGDKSLIGQTDKQNMTIHEWFQNTNCPGYYMRSKLGYIADEVNKILANSENSTEKVKLLYAELLGREADAGGLKSFLELMDNKGFEAVHNNIGESEEGRRYFIKQMYRDLLGRAAARSEIEHWKNKSRADILTGIINSKEYQQKR